MKRYSILLAVAAIALTAAACTPNSLPASTPPLTGTSSPLAPGASVPGQNVQTAFCTVTGAPLTVTLTADEPTADIDAAVAILQLQLTSSTQLDVDRFTLGPTALAHTSTFDLPGPGCYEIAMGTNATNFTGQPYYGPQFEFYASW